MEKMKNIAISFVLLLFVFLLLLFIATIFKSLLFTKIFGGVAILLTALLTLVGYLFTKMSYKGIGVKGPLFVPKALGVGITINPYHWLGKCIWLGLELLLIVVLIQFLLA